MDGEITLNARIEEFAIDKCKFSTPTEQYVSDPVQPQFFFIKCGAFQSVFRIDRKHSTTTKLTDKVIDLE